MVHFWKMVQGQNFDQTCFVCDRFFRWFVETKAGTSFGPRPGAILLPCCHFAAPKSAEAPWMRMNARWLEMLTEWTSFVEPASSLSILVKPLMWPMQTWLLWCRCVGDGTMSRKEVQLSDGRRFEYQPRQKVAWKILAVPFMDKHVNKSAVLQFRN